MFLLLISLYVCSSSGRLKDRNQNMLSVHLCLELAQSSQIFFSVCFKSTWTSVPGVTVGKSADLPLSVLVLFLLQACCGLLSDT